ncbi:MAG: TrkH family potassium uptake protein [Bacillota bacterium]
MQGTKARGPRISFTPAQILVLGFAGLILLGTILLSLPIAVEPGNSISVVDALFTATSAVCVTGLIVVDTPTYFSTFGEIVIMLLIQMGGLGIMTISMLMFMLLGRRISLQERLLMQEALGSFSIAGVVRLTRNIILVTLGIEAVGATLLTFRLLALDYPLSQSLYWGIFHAVSAWNNAGFDLTSQSMRLFNRDPFILMVIAALFVLGGLGFLVLEDIWRKRSWERFTLQTKLVLKVTGLLILIPSVIFLALEYANPNTFGPLPWIDKIVNAIFTAITPRTAGFESIPTAKLANASLLLTIILMYIGASPGGTGGGIKTTTLSMIVLTIRSTAIGLEETQVMGRRLARDLLDKAVTIAAIAMTLIVTVVGLLLVTERQAVDNPAIPITFIDVMFEVVSAFGTVGLTTGLTPELTVPGRILITLTMFVGRVGPLTMAVALAQRKFARTHIQYPEERVMIG